MPNLGQVNYDAMLYMLKGEPGTRKSTQALSFPGPQYWFSTDRKMEALLLPAKKWGIDPKNITFDEHNNYDEIIVKLNQLLVNCPYKTIVIDSVTSMGDTINSQTIAGKTGDNKAQLVGGIAVNSLDEYKAEANGFREIMRLLLRIRKTHTVNVILIAHVVGTREKDKSDTTHQSRIIITGGKVISGKIASYCGEVYHFDVETNIVASKEGTYRIITSHTGDDFARSSLGLPRSISFGDNPIYKTYVLPAIEKQTEKQSAGSNGKG